MKARVKFDVEIPEEVSIEEAKDWIRFEIKVQPDIALDNALYIYEIDPCDVEIEIYK